MAIRRIIGRIMIVLGAALITAALLLVAYNYYHESKSKAAMDKVLVKLENKIPEQPQQEDNIESASPFAVFEQEEISHTDEPEPPAEEEAPTVDIDGRIYMGLLTMPTLGQEFPVIKGWSYDDMNIAPCQYSGTRAGRDLIICSHNYAGFFDSLEELRAGDEVIFTDLNGRKFTYEISYTELISGWDGNKMFAGAKTDWDMTLFTCTWSGYSRVTCRCVLKK